MVEKIFITAENISKRFKRNLLFKDIAISCKTGDSIAIVGPNGSGKSTLLQIFALLKTPSLGTVIYNSANTPIAADVVRKQIGFCSPAMNLYEGLTAFENLHFASGISDKEKLMQNLADYKLMGHEHKLVRHYSSGMKQRLKILCAMINWPPVLFFDEPGLALDSQGKELVYSAIDKRKSDSIIFFATNDAAEAALCKKRIELGL